VCFGLGWVETTTDDPYAPDVPDVEKCPKCGGRKGDA